jgi:hypothetical protein
MSIKKMGKIVQNAIVLMIAIHLTSIGNHIQSLNDCLIALDPQTWDEEIKMPITTCR